jgi:hypothetical protein
MVVYRKLVLDLLFIMGGTVISVLYIELVTPILEGFVGIAINIIFFVFMGICLGLAMKGSFLTKGLLVALIPMLQSFYFTPDPAKPGLETPVALIEFVLLILGLLIAIAVTKMKAVSPSRA